MNRDQVIKKAMVKLSEVNKDIINTFIKDMKEIYRANRSRQYEDTSFPKEIIKYVGDFMDDHDLTQREKISLLAEAKRNKFFNFSLNKNLEKAWRLILKKWDISEYRLEGGI